MNLRTVAALGAITGLLNVGGTLSGVALAETRHQDTSLTTQVDDGWITTKIKSQFIGVDVLDGSNISVDTNNGVVTLTGTVPSKAARARAAAIARETDGVKKVVDKTTIGPATSASSDMSRATEATKAEAKDAAESAKQTGQDAGTAMNDGWITTKLKAKFVPEDVLEGSELAVETNNGVVMLSGPVPSEAARQRALQLARDTEGVRQVVDKMRVAAPGPDAAHSASEATERAADRAAGAAERTGETVTDGWITAKVKSQFIGVDSLEGSDINVDTKDGIVTLKGTVRTAAGREKAATIAKEIDGVKKIDNRLVVGDRK